MAVDRLIPLEPFLGIRANEEHALLVGVAAPDNLLGAPGEA